MTSNVNVSVDVELPDGHKILLTREGAEELYRALDIALHGHEPQRAPAPLQPWWPQPPDWRGWPVMCGGGTQI